MLKANFLGNTPKSGSFAFKTSDFPDVRLLRHEAYVYCFSDDLSSSTNRSSSLHA